MPWLHFWKHIETNIINLASLEYLQIPAFLPERMINPGQLPFLWMLFFQLKVTWNRRGADCVTVEMERICRTEDCRDLIDGHARFRCCGCCSEGRLAALFCALCHSRQGLQPAERQRRRLWLTLKVPNCLNPFLIYLRVKEMRS